MDADTIARLEAINQRFYASRAEEFSEARRSPWPGWRRLLPHLPARRPLRVLDAGCGNGRFALFLERHCRVPIEYLGIDASFQLVSEARARLAALAAARVEQGDLTAAGPSLALGEEDFELVAVFGVLHHVPGRERRRALLLRLGERLAAGGLLAVSTWQFARLERFRRRIIPWLNAESVAGVAVDPAQLEPDDHLLAWGASGGGGGCRYCHFTSDEEMGEHAAALGLELVCDYCDDGATRELNHYWLFRPTSSALRRASS